MDVVHPSSNNDSYDYSYEDYYSLVAGDDVRPCEKHRARTFSQAFLPAFYSVVCVLSLITNSTLIAIFIKHRSLRKAPPLNMVGANLLFTLTLPFWAVYAHKEWVFGSHACKAITGFYIVGLFSSNLFFGSLTLQTCVRTACATLQGLGTCRRNTWACAGIWLLSLLAAAPHLVFVEAYEFQKQMICTYHFTHKHGWRIYMRIQLVVVGFCGPFLALLFSFGAVLYTMGRRPSLPQTPRTLKQVLGFTVLFFVLWFPYSVVNMLHALQELHIISECSTSLNLDLAIQGTECVAFIHMCLNPVAYILLNQKICRKLRGVYTAPVDYLLSSSDSSDVESSQKSMVELKSLQRISNPDLDSMSTERQGHLLPHPF